MKKIFTMIGYPFAKAYHFINDAIYNLKVKIHSKRKPRPDDVQKNWTRINKIRDLIFYCAWMVIPLAFFILLYVFVNGGSIVLAFQSTTEGVTSFAGFNNFVEVVSEFLSNPALGIYLGKSLMIYGVTVIFQFLPMLFSFYIYKRMAGHKIFTVILFLPTILSSIITVAIFRMVANQVIPEIMIRVFGTQVKPLLTNINTAFGTLLFYSVWMGFGSGLLTQLAAMNSIDPSVREAAQLDGVTFFQEFWHIAFPATYQVIMLVFITGFAGIFTNQLNFYAFYGESTPHSSLGNLGYYIQVETLKANAGKLGAHHDFHWLSAYGLMITLITVPITLLMKHFIFTYGPSEDTREKRKKA